MAIFKVKNEKGEWIEVPAIVGPQGPAGPTQIYDGIDSELTDWALSAKQGKVLHDAINSVWNKIYPVGSIYMSVIESNPATLFGGTWERIEGQFLIGCNSTYPNGTSGGAANTTLATANLPGHTHSFSATSGNQSANHTHSVGAHSHGLNSHTHSVGAHSHGLNGHTHSIPALSGTAASNGAHTHQCYKSWGFKVGTGGLNYVMGTIDDGFSGSGNWTGSSGAHTHSVSTSASTTGGNSGSTANSGAFNSGAASGSTANSSAFNTGNNSANHTHSVSGTTGSTGSATSFTNLPPYLSVYIWKRTA